MQSGGAPRDRYWLVYCTFVLLGVAFLLPWNTFITETAFIGVRVRQPPYFPHVADTFESLIVAVFQTMNLLSVLALPAVQRSVTLGKQVVAPLAASSAVLVAMAGLAAWPAASGRTVAGLALASVALVGACSGVLQSGIFSLASCLPPIYVQGASLGMGVAGLFTALLSFSTALAAPPGAGPATARELGPAALAYFAVSAAVIVAALAAYLNLPLSRFWRAFSGAAPIKSRTRKSYKP